MPPSAAEITWIAKFLGVSEDAVKGSRTLARQVEIMQDMADSGRTFDGRQAEVDDGPADPDFNEPGRMLALDKGPMPDRQSMPMKNIRSTQNTVSPTTSDGRPISDMAGNMEREGWDPSSPGVDMVQNEHGGGTTLDHRRLMAAEEAGLDEVPAEVHGPDDPLPDGMGERFTLERAIKDADGKVEVPKGTEAETWGEAARFRAANQRPGRAYAGDPTAADDTYHFPPDGDTHLPYIKDKPPPSPAEAAEAAAKDAEDAAEAERLNFDKRADAKLAELKDTDPKLAKAIEDVKREFDQAEARREADLDPDAQPSEPEPGVPDPVKPNLGARPSTRPGQRGGPGPAADMAPLPEPAAQAHASGSPPAPQAPAEAPGTPAPAAEPVATAAAEPAAPAAPKPIAAGTGAPEAEATAGADAGAGAALGAGAVGGLMAGALTLLGDVGKVRSGQMTTGDAAKDVGAKTAETGALTYAGARAADTLVKGAATATSGAEGALAGAGADAAAAAAGAESAAAGAGAAAAGASLASVASKGGVIGGVVAGGLALIDDVGKVRDGQMTGGTATVDVGVKTAVGVGAGMAGAAAGAEIGALAGSVVPGIGNVVGFVAGAVVGGAVGYVGNKLMETETGRKAIHAAGAAVDTAIHGVEAAGAAVGHEAAAAGKAVAGAAGAAVEGVEHAAGAVADAASGAAHAVEDTASHVLDGASSLFGKIKDAL